MVMGPSDDVVKGGNAMPFEQAGEFGDDLLDQPGIAEEGGADGDNVRAGGREFEAVLGAGDAADTGDGQSGDGAAVEDRVQGDGLHGRPERPPPPPPRSG